MTERRVKIVRVPQYKVEIPNLHNADTVVEMTTKTKKIKPQDEDRLDEKRAIILNFTRHPVPPSFIESLRSIYEQRITTFVPIEPLTLVREDTVRTTQVIAQITGESSDMLEPTKYVDQIRNWLYEYLTTIRKTKSYPLDRLGDHFIFLPTGESQIAVEIVLALQAIKKIDWVLCWPEYHRDTNSFVVRELVSVKETHRHWKTRSHQVESIMTHKLDELRNTLFQLPTAEVDQYLQQIKETDPILYNKYMYKQSQSQNQSE